jgi:hypothetical protein
MFTLSFTCAHLNDLFSQELAETQHSGEETADNHRYHWEDELEVQDVLAVNITKDAAYSLRGALGSGTEFSYEIGGVTLISLALLAGKEVQFAISNQLLNSINQTNDADRQHILVELKDNEPFINPIPGVYIANHDVPNELLTHAPD